MTPWPCEPHHETARQVPRCIKDCQVSKAVCIGECCDKPQEAVRRRDPSHRLRATTFHSRKQVCVTLQEALTSCELPRVSPCDIR